MSKNNSRIGTFSSSSIWKLAKKGKAKESLGKPALTYIQEKILEKRLGRQLENESISHALSWGNLCEDVALATLGLANQNHNERLKYPNLEWTGQPDYILENLVGDIKCPFTLKSFCEMYEIQTAEDLKKIRQEYYWQLVSNAILAKKEECELTIFVPYLEQLELIRELARAMPESEQNQFAWVNWAKDIELPYLIKGSCYNQTKQIKFKPLKGDVEFLIKRIKFANLKLKNEFPIEPNK